MYVIALKFAMVLVYPMKRELLRKGIRLLSNCQIKPHIRVVSLDITGTLLRFRSPIGQIYYECAIQCMLPNPPSADEFNVSFKASFSSASKSYPCYGFHNQISERDWWKIVVRDTLTNCGRQYPKHKFDSYFRAVYQEFGKPASYVLFPDTLTFLQRLKSMKTIHGERLLVGTLTNSPQRTLECTLPALDLQQYLHWYVSCLDIGQEKPSKQIFDHTFELLRKQIPDLNRNEIMHIGDNLNCDWEGARNAGFQSLLLGKLSLHSI